VGVIAALIAGGMFTLIVPELQWIVYVFIILAAAVLVYRLFKRE
jgi:membrane protein implicated in regulation of membrane protease activity